MKKIIVPTDFSVAARSATNYAADMAMAIGADILLLHVLYIPITYTDVPAAITPEQLEKDMEEKMGDLRKDLLHKTGHKINITTEVRTGTLLRELQDIASKLKPYAVIMGSQGASATEYSIFGSQSANALRHLDCPVIAVPTGIMFNSIKKVALACDFENVVDRVPVDEIEKLVNDFNSQLFVINTDKSRYHDADMIFESGLLQIMLEGLHPKYHFITNKDIDEGIMDFCEKNNIDLLVVMPKRHTLIDKLIHRSHTKQLVLQSHVPVMALHE